MTETKFKLIVDFIWKNRKKYQKLMDEDLDGSFDYPDYGGLPKKISYTLSPEAVDALQDIWSEVTGRNIYNKPYLGAFKTKREFVKSYKKRLFELGEPIKKAAK